MFDENEEQPAERAFDPVQRAIEKTNECRSHAELAAIFEGCTKFDARLKPGLDADVAREVQRGMARLDKARTENNPILPETSLAEAVGLLTLSDTRELSTNDYHIHRRPGETMIVRWIGGDEVETFYTRLQAHFDAALNGYRAEERQAQEWKQDAAMLKYLDTLDAVDVRLADRFLRDPIRQHGLAVLSTQTADEMNIAYLCDFVMSVPAADVVGAASAPPEEPSEQDLAWFFKLFLLRGVSDGVERMCFFTFLQKSDDSFGD
ncbi:MAG TPA: hypothetical protein VF595_00525 [Tepidisphaeraceae bacterium]